MITSKITIITDLKLDEDWFSTWLTLQYQMESDSVPDEDWFKIW